MKKMVMVLMMVFGLSAAFAYEPKVECAIADKRGNIKYDETYCEENPRIDRFFTLKKRGAFTNMYCCTFESMWAILGQARANYDAYIDVAKYKDETCSTCAFIEKYKSAYENNELSKTEMEQYEAIVDLHSSANDLASAIEGRPAHAKTDTKSYWELCAKEEKEKVIDRLPFVTDKNWKTITKEELLEKIDDFGRKCSKNYNPDNFLTKMERKEILNSK